MALGGKLLKKLVGEFGEAAVKRAAVRLGADATEDALRASLTRSLAVKGAAKPAAKAPPVGLGGLSVPLDVAATVKPMAAPAIISARSGAPLAVARDVLQMAANPKTKSAGFSEWREANPENGKLFDLSNLDRVPNVPQHQMPRYVPPRGPNARMVDALANPEVVQTINAAVERGIAGGGKEWYNTEPVLDVMRGIMPTIDAPQEYAGMLDLMSATSPQSRVTDNIRIGSYYNYLRAQGLPIPPKPAGGYGSKAQDLHRSNSIGLRELGGWDIFKNPKPASFAQDLRGNQEVVTIDTHNMRLPGIASGDPRFLSTSISEPAKDPEAALAALRRNYPGLPEAVVQGALQNKKGGPKIIYAPQSWVNDGYISMEAARKDPALWVGKPNENEYGYYESWQQDQARKMGISPAQYQASMWLGAGDETGLGSAPEPFAATFDARIRYTADQLGLDPEKVRDMMLRGEIPLLAEGGPVRASYAVNP